ncbi:SRPBCC family protein [Mechercharimyces sp. CAU 1602]|uniref:SRPBCC family protein n=1 Tax=Mechercharimyces sp. CAU 1602 TaxID=2973933 RepID=UPI00216222C2|nr:SRPBCC family protein [Mechercharimyces sp. CAU 1602]MCS1351917.1 SRPBCC family protein [Mechercharimyces sp. CAU 1602]
MKSWTEEIKINAPITQVWTLFDGSIENMQKIMPQVVDNQPKSITPDIEGSTYLQKYREGKRVMEYEVEILSWKEKEEYKKMKVGFTIAKMFSITAEYELFRLDDQHTRFRYTATNKPLTWLARLFLLFANKRVVVQFVERVKNVAESERS